MDKQPEDINIEKALHEAQQNELLGALEKRTSGERREALELRRQLKTDISEAVSTILRSYGLNGNYFLNVKMDETYTELKGKLVGTPQFSVIADDCSTD